MDEELIKEMLDYIEITTVSNEGEWGVGRSLEEIKSDGDMPNLYYKIVVLINGL